MNGYSCVCEPGWTGKRCSVNINDCATDPCQNGGSCFVSVKFNNVGCHNATSMHPILMSGSNCWLFLCLSSWLDW